MSGYIDGNYAAPYLVSNVVNYPFSWPNNGTTAMFELEYVQYANAYSAAALGATSGDAPSAYLVEQGPVTKPAPGMVRFRRVYCQIPTAWTETQMTAYTYPGLSGPPVPNATTFNPYYRRSPITLYTAATVEHTYTQSATSPTLDNIFQVTDNANVVDYIGPQNPAFGSGSTDPAIEPSTYVIASESRLVVGQIWEKTKTTVNKPV
jgi:hypothetical protein